MTMIAMTDAALERSATQHAPALVASTQKRFESLDAYRGLIMSTLLCGSIFGSLKGHPTWNWLSIQNEHVAWEGCTYWDLIQPSFMYMVGVAMPFALARRTASGDSWRKRLGHVLTRAFGLILIGVLLDNFGARTLNFGFMRVLQQIAIGYVIAFFVVGRSFQIQAATAAAILVGYNLLWMFNPWNGPSGSWAQGNANIGSAFDFWMLGRHYSGYYVGMNAIPATATIIFGAMAGQLVRSEQSRRKTMLILLIAGLGGITVGLLVSPWLPLIKRIWTPSFTVFAAGWTTLMLLFFYWSIEAMGWRRWSFPLQVVGMNSIAAYVLGNAFGGWFRSLFGAWIGWFEQPLGSIWFPVFQHLVVFCSAWLVLYWLWRRRIFLKV
jgi:heparan-alpha-glucosaminide N-acetyltransferase